MDVSSAERESSSRCVLQLRRIYCLSGVFPSTWGSVVLFGRHGTHKDWLIISAMLSCILDVQCRRRAVQRVLCGIEVNVFGTRLPVVSVAGCAALRFEGRDVISALIALTQMHL